MLLTLNSSFSVRSSKRVLQKDWKTHGVPFYRTRELVSLYNNEPFSSEIFISEELFSEIAKKYGFPSEGDFLVSGVGTLGICYQVKAKDKFYFKDGNVLWYKQNGGIVSSFFYYCFHSDQIQNQILGQASISTVGTYTIQNAKVTKFLCPTVEKEQQKIAHCLSSLDEVMGLQAKKVQALKQHKKGLMQQLFPAEGETTPHLRFPEFREAGAWEKKRLGTQGGFLTPLSGKSAKDFDTGDAKFIPYMNVFSNTFTDIQDLRSVIITDDESQNAVAKGDVFFTVSSETPEEAGMSSVLLGDVDRCYLNSFCALFRFDDHLSPNLIFLGYLLRSRSVRCHLSRGAQGATRYNISKLVFKELEFRVSNIVPPYIFG